MRSIEKRLENLEGRFTRKPARVFFEKQDGSIFDLQHTFNFPDRQTFETYADEHFESVILFTPHAAETAEDVPGFLKPGFCENH
jgi:hypothetical protein